jgi:hypothetical protein
MAAIPAAASSASNPPASNPPLPAAVLPPPVSGAPDGVTGGFGVLLGTGAELDGVTTGGVVELAG